MPTLAWRCDRCNSHFSTEDAARACEIHHATVVAGLSIRGATFRCVDGLYGSELGMAGMVPRDVIVNFGSGSRDFATYRLERVGPKGL